jgi:membrane protease YdiL (CAAX protease family)
MNEQELITNNTEPELTYRPFKFRDIIFACLFFGWSQINAILLLQMTSTNNTAKAITLGISLLGNGLLIWQTFRIIQKARKTNEDKAPEITPKAILKIAGITLLMLFATAIISSLLNIQETTNQNALDDFFKTIPFLAAMHIVIVAPICEDMCFRYYLLRPGKLWQLRFILSGILFILIHVAPGESFLSLIAYLVPAAFLHGTRLMSGSVRYSLMLHMFYNAIVTGLMFAALATA